MTTFIRPAVCGDASDGSVPDEERDTRRLQSLLF